MQVLLLYNRRPTTTAGKRKDNLVFILFKDKNYLRFYGIESNLRK